MVVLQPFYRKITMKHISIGETSIILGVSVVTLRRWDKTNKLTHKFRTFGGHRRYNFNEIISLVSKKEQPNKKVIGYSRVSSSDQKKDLRVQSEVITNYIKSRYNNFEIIEDVGSGLNYKKAGLKKLIKMICNREISALILTHKDRLLRFGSDIVISICEKFNIEVVVLNSDTTATESFEKTLCDDIISIITVFSAKLYGARSHKNKKSLKAVV